MSYQGLLLPPTQSVPRQHAKSLHHLQKGRAGLEDCETGTKGPHPTAGLQAPLWLMGRLAPNELHYCTFGAILLFPAGQLLRRESKQLPRRPGAGSVRKGSFPALNLFPSHSFQALTLSVPLGNTHPRNEGEQKKEERSCGQESGAQGPKSGVGSITISGSASLWPWGWYWVWTPHKAHRSAFHDHEVYKLNGDTLA